jgi:hypothetical protein
LYDVPDRARVNLLAVACGRHQVAFFYARAVACFRMVRPVTTSHKYWKDQLRRIFSGQRKNVTAPRMVIIEFLN